MPIGWQDWIAVLAHRFHFPPSELMAMDAVDFRFWQERAIWLGRELSKRG